MFDLGNVKVVGCWELSLWSNLMLRGKFVIFVAEVWDFFLSPNTYLEESSNKSAFLDEVFYCWRMLSATKHILINSLHVIKGSLETAADFHSFTHLFIHHLLGPCYVPGTALGAMNLKMNWTIPWTQGACSLSSWGVNVFNQSSIHLINNSFIQLITTSTY